MIINLRHAMRELNNLRRLIAMLFDLDSFPTGTEFVVTPNGKLQIRVYKHFFINGRDIGELTKSLEGKVEECDIRTKDGFPEHINYEINIEDVYWNEERIPKEVKIKVINSKKFNTSKKYIVIFKIENDTIEKRRYGNKRMTFGDVIRDIRIYSTEGKKTVDNLKKDKDMKIVISSNKNGSKKNGKDIEKDSEKTSKKTSNNTVVIPNNIDNTDKIRSDAIIHDIDGDGDSENEIEIDIEGEKESENELKKRKKRRIKAREEVEGTRSTPFQRKRAEAEMRFLKNEFREFKFSFEENDVVNPDYIFPESEKYGEKINKDVDIVKVESKKGYYSDNYRIKRIEQKYMPENDQEELEDKVYEIYEFGTSNTKSSTVRITLKTVKNTVVYPLTHTKEQIRRRLNGEEEEKEPEPVRKRKTRVRRVEDTSRYIIRNRNGSEREPVEISPTRIRRNNSPVSLNTRIVSQNTVSGMDTLNNMTNINVTNNVTNTTNETNGNNGTNEFNIQMNNEFNIINNDFNESPFVSGMMYELEGYNNVSNSRINQIQQTNVTNQAQINPAQNSISFDQNNTNYDFINNQYCPNDYIQQYSQPYDQYYNQSYNQVYNQVQDQMYDQMYDPVCNVQNIQTQNLIIPNQSATGLQNSLYQQMECNQNESTFSIVYMNSVNNQRFDEIQQGNQQGVQNIPINQNQINDYNMQMQLQMQMNNQVEGTLNNGIPDPNDPNGIIAIPDGFSNLLQQGFRFSDLFPPDSM